MSFKTSAHLYSNLSIFYNFIIKKIPKIEQQFPLMISKSFPNDISQNTKKENNKKFFIHFQKQVYNLLIELIEFCYKEKIIKLNNEIEKYLSQLKSKDNKNIEMQKFLIYLIINNKVNCNIYPKDYLKFFNTETKKRIIAERFLNFSNNLIKIYKDNKKNIKIVSNTEKKISNSKKILILEKKNQTLEKNDGLCMGVGIKFFEEKFEMLKDIGFDEEIVEDGETFEENSEIKARAIEKYCKNKGIILLRFNNLKTVEQDLMKYFQNRGIIEQTIFNL